MADTAKASEEKRRLEEVERLERLVRRANEKEVDMQQQINTLTRGQIEATRQLADTKGQLDTLTGNRAGEVNTTATILSTALNKMAVSLALPQLQATLPPFSEACEQFSTFASWAERYHKVTQHMLWDDAQRAESLPMNLMGPANVYYQKLDASTRTSWAAARAALVTWLDKPPMPSCMEVQSIVPQKPSESLSSFNARVWQSVQRAFPTSDYSAAQQDRQARDLFLNKLRSDDLRLEVVKQDPATLIDALNAVKKYEVYVSANAKTRSSNVNAVDAEHASYGYTVGSGNPKFNRPNPQHNPYQAGRGRGGHPSYGQNRLQLNDQGWQGTQRNAPPQPNNVQNIQKHKRGRGRGNGRGKHWSQQRPQQPVFPSQRPYQTVSKNDQHQNQYDSVVTAQKREIDRLKTELAKCKQPLPKGAWTGGQPAKPPNHAARFGNAHVALVSTLCIMAMIIPAACVKTERTYNLCGRSRTAWAVDVPRTIECVLPEAAEVVHGTADLYTIRNVPEQLPAVLCTLFTRTICTHKGVPLIGKSQIISDESRSSSIPDEYCREYNLTEMYGKVPIVQMQPGLRSTNQTGQSAYNWLYGANCMDTMNVVLESGTVGTMDGTVVMSDLTAMGGCDWSDALCIGAHGTVIWNGERTKTFCSYSPLGRYDIEYSERHAIIHELQSAFVITSPMRPVPTTAGCLPEDAKWLSDDVAIRFVSNTTRLTEWIKRSQSPLPGTDMTPSTAAELEFMGVEWASIERARFKKVWQTLCTLANRVLHTCLQQLRIDATTGARCLLQRDDITAEYAGEALLIWQCRQITPTSIYWTHEYNGSCWHYLPIRVNSTVLFVVSGSLDVVDTSAKVPCTHRPVGYHKESAGWMTSGGAAHVAKLPLQLIWHADVKPFTFTHPNVFHDAKAGLQATVDSLSGQQLRTAALERQIIVLRAHALSKVYDPNPLLNALTKAEDAAVNVTETFVAGLVHESDSIIDHSMSAVDRILSAPAQALANALTFALVAGLFVGAVSLWCWWRRRCVLTHNPTPSSITNQSPEQALVESHVRWPSFTNAVERRITPPPMTPLPTTDTDIQPTVLEGRNLRMPGHPMWPDMEDPQRRMPLLAVDIVGDSGATSPSYYVESYQSEIVSHRLTLEITIGSTKRHCLIDTQSEVSIVPMHIWNVIKAGCFTCYEEPPTIRLKGLSKVTEPVAVVGYANVYLEHKYTRGKFYVLPADADLTEVLIGMQLMSRLALPFVVNPKMNYVSPLVMEPTDSYPAQPYNPDTALAGGMLECSVRVPTRVHAHTSVAVPMQFTLPVSKAYMQTRSVVLQPRCAFFAHRKLTAMTTWHLTHQKDLRLLVSNNTHADVVLYRDEILPTAIISQRDNQPAHAHASDAQNIPSDTHTLMKVGDSANYASQAHKHDSHDDSDKENVDPERADGHDWWPNAASPAPDRMYGLLQDRPEFISPPEGREFDNMSHNSQYSALERELDTIMNDYRVYMVREEPMEGADDQIHIVDCPTNDPPTNHDLLADPPIATTAPSCDEFNHSPQLRHDPRIPLQTVGRMPTIDDYESVAQSVLQDMIAHIAARKDAIAQLRVKLTHYAEVVAVHNERLRSALAMPPELQEADGEIVPIVSLIDVDCELVPSIGDVDVPCRPERIFVHAKVGGYESGGLLDSGAAISIGTHKAYLDIIKSGSFREAVSPIRQIKSVSGNFVPIVATAEVDVEIGPHMRTILLHVIPDGHMPHELILGYDYLYALGTVTFNFRTRALRVHTADDERVLMEVSALDVPKLEPLILPPHYPLAVKTTTVVPANTIMAVPIKWDASIDVPDQKELLIEGIDHKLHERYDLLSFASAHTYLQLNELCMYVANVTNNQVIVYRHAQVAVVTFIDPTRQNVDDIAAYQTRLSTDIAMFTTDTGDEVAETTGGGDGQSQLREYTMEELLDELNWDEMVLTTEQKGIFYQYMLTRRSNLVAKHSCDVGNCTLPPCHIDTGDAKPVYQKARPVRFNDRAEIQRQLDAMMVHTIIRRSTSEWASPLHPVLKHNAAGEVTGLRLTVDLRRLNEVTRPNRYTLPRMDQVLQTAQSAKLMSNLDLNAGFWNLRIAEEDKCKTAFSCFYGLFEFNKLCFGLRNAPSIFQAAVDRALAGLLWQSCVVYLDDCLVFADSFESMMCRLDEVFDRLEHFDFRLNLKKCAFFQTRMPFLGMILENGTMQPNPAKTAALKNLRPPSNQKELLSLQDLFSYYRVFVRDLARRTYNMRQLMKINPQFMWTSIHTAEMADVVDTLTSAPILAMPRFNEPFTLYTDASIRGLGAALEQMSPDDGRLHPVAFASRGLSDAESRYPAIHLEALAIHWAVNQALKVYCYGNKVSVVTDHLPLKQLLTSTDMTGRLLKYRDHLQGGLIDIVYRPGRVNHADILSRLPADPWDGDDVYGDDSGAPYVHVSEHDPSFCIRRYDAEACESPAPCIADYAADILSGEQVCDLTPTKTLSYQMEDEFCRDLIIFKTLGTLPIHVDSEDKRMCTQYENRARDYTLVNGCLYRLPIHNVRRPHDPQLVVPENLVVRVLYACHGDKTGGHLGRDKTMSRVSRHFYWPAMAMAVKAYVQSCVKCAARKNPPTRTCLPLHPLTIPCKPFVQIAMDHKHLVLDGKGYKYALVFVDYFTKYVTAYACHTLSTEETAAHLVRHMSRFGACRLLISDQATTYMSATLKEVNRLFGTTHITSVAYHPQSHGQVERLQSTIGDMLHMYSDKDHDWSDSLDTVCFAYNNSVSRITNETPHFLAHGWDPTLPICTLLIDPTELNVDYPTYREQLAVTLNHAWKCAAARIEDAQDKMKGNYDSHVRLRYYRLNDRVRLWVPALHAGDKLYGAKWCGPFPVVALQDENCHLQLIAHPRRKIKVAHMNQIKPDYDTFMPTRPFVKSSTVAGLMCVDDQNTVVPESGDKTLPTHTTSRFSMSCTSTVCEHAVMLAAEAAVEKDWLTDEDDIVADDKKQMLEKQQLCEDCACPTLKTDYNDVHICPFCSLLQCLTCQQRPENVRVRLTRHKKRHPKLAELMQERATGVPFAL